LSFSYLGKLSNLSTLKPIDVFARDMLSFIAEKFGLKVNWMPKVKILFSTDSFWMRLWSIAQQTKRYSPVEFKEEMKPSPENWLKVNGYVLQPTSVDSEGKIEFRLSDEMRVRGLVDLGFPREYAERLSVFDAVIFLHTSNLKEAEDHGQYFPVHLVVTHECVHIAERLSGQFFIRDFDTRFFEHPIVENTLASFLDKLGIQEFVRRYGAPRLTSLR